MPEQHTRPSRIEVELFVKTVIGNLASPVVDPSTLHETTVIDTVVGPGARLPHLAESLRGFVKRHGGKTLTARELRQDMTIGELVDIILDKWS